MAWLLSAAVAAGVLQNKLFLLAAVGAPLARAVVLGARAAWAWAGLAAACALIGAAGAERIRADAAHVARLAAGRARVTVELTGRVASFPSAGPYGTSFLYDTEIEGRNTRLLMRAAFFDVDYGDALTCIARVTLRPGDAHLLSRGAVATARTRLRDTRSLAPAGRTADPRRALWSLHRAARTRLSRALAGDAALPLGLMLGERGYLERPLRDAVVRLGIAHLLALSGMHLAVVAAIAVLLSRALRRGRDLVILLALSVYIGTVGDVASLTRAYLMAVLLVAARALARPARPVDALAKTLLVMLLVSPVSILSVGLQLSFAATFAVLLVIERMPLFRAGKRVEGGGPARFLRRAGSAAAGVVVLSIAVELVIAPLQFHHFGRVSVVGPAATALFVLPITVIQVMTIVATPLLDVPVAGDAAAACLAAASRAVVESVLAAASLAPDPIAGDGPHPLLYYAALAVAWKWPRRAAARSLAALLTASAFLTR